MNALAFSALMNHPELLRNYSLNELQELAQCYPYASAIYSMIALKAHMDDDGNYEHYLNQAALRIPDRKKLYHLIHAEYEVTEQPADLQEKPLHFDDDFETTVFKKEDSTLNTPPSSPPVQEEPVVQEEMKVEEELIPASPTYTIHSQEETTDKEDSTPDTPPPTLEPPSIDLPGSDEVLDALSALKGFQKKNEEERKEVILEKIDADILPEQKTEPAIPDESDAHSFSEWLSLLNKDKKAIDKPESKPEEKPLPVESFVADSIELESAPVLTEEEQEIEEIIIDKQAKASLAQDDELVTETLAKIYEIQRKYDKAIKAYQILSLKYPDKRAYFADKIEKLKNR